VSAAPPEGAGLETTADGGGEAVEAAATQPPSEAIAAVTATARAATRRRWRRGGFAVVGADAEREGMRRHRVARQGVSGVLLKRVLGPRRCG